MLAQDIQALSEVALQGKNFWVGLVHVAMVLHWVQDAAPKAVLYFPLRHCVQLAEVTAAVTVLNFPASQSKHVPDVTAPVDALYVPGPHDEQALAPKAVL